MSMRPKRQYAIRSSAESDKALRSHPHISITHTNMTTERQWPVIELVGLVALKGESRSEWYDQHRNLLAWQHARDALAAIGIFWEIARPWERT